MAESKDLTPTDRARSRMADNSALGEWDSKQIVDLTPTWRGLMPALIAVLQDGSPEGKKEVAKELMRLADAVDKSNERGKSE